ncbi:DSC E3 ubiquitin ligase complex subunit 4 [Botrytis cinerea]
MNNDFTSVSGPSATPPNGRSGPSSRRRRHRSSTPAQKRAYEQMRKKYELASSLMANLDFAVYCQLCVLYYMDCSFFQLFIRALTQFIILTPKPKNVRQPPQSSSWVVMLLGTNILYYDAEERGVLRDPVAGLEDIEMQSLGSTGAASRPRTREFAAGANEQDEREELLAEPVNREPDDSPLDIFWSGTAVIGEFSVLDTLRSQLALSGAASGSSRANSLSANVAELTARNPRLDFIARRFQRSLQ